MKKFLFLITMAISMAYCFGQQAVTDHANEGQLKRMVYDQWDDWQPDPNTNWLGLPKNFEGWIWWNWVYHDYYNGDDQRPYRSDGPFLQNQLSLTLQKQDDLNIVDTTNGVRATNLATFLNMSGDNLDTPYDLYFKSKFQKLTTIELENMTIIATKNPTAYSRLLYSKVYTDYMEKLDVLSSRIQTNHSAFVEKGERIITYLDIKKQLEFANKVIENYMVTYLNSTIAPDVHDLKTNAATANHYPSNDAQIVNNILRTFKY